MSTTAGTVLVITSSVAFGAMPLFARLAYADGIEPVSLLFFRFSIAALFMGLLMLIRKERFPALKVIAGLALMGAIGYVGQSLCFFSALTMANSGLVVLLLYLYPALVALLSAVFHGERLNGSRGVAVALAFLGTALTVGPQLNARPLGVILGISAACIYSVYIMSGNRLMKQVTPVAGSAIIMAAAGAAFGLLSLGQGLTLPRSLSGWTGVIGLAIIATVIAVTTFLVGLTLIGPTRASVLSTFEPVTAILLAAFFLGEPIGFWTMAGGVLIIAATIILARSGGTPAPRAVPVRKRPWFKR